MWVLPILTTSLQLFRFGRDRIAQGDHCWYQALFYAHGRGDIHCRSTAQYPDTSFSWLALTDCSQTVSWALSAGRLGRRLFELLGAALFRKAGFVRIFRELFADGLALDANRAQNKRRADCVLE
jgi:hypothetical protein